MCCHPALSRPSQVALTLRAVGGLTTAEISRALLVPEATVAQRISRAKRQVQDAGASFDVPVPGELDERVTAVLSVLYLIFNEGYAASSGYELQRVDLTREAIRLTRMLHAQLPGHGEVGGLLALMLLTAARDPARVTPTGDLLPLDVQDRGLWRQDLISEGTTLLEYTLAVTPLGPYQLQAAIAAVHDTAPFAQDTDWAQALALSQVLERLDPTPMARLGTAVATAMVHGTPAGLQAMDRLAQDPILAEHHRRHAVLAHLWNEPDDSTKRQTPTIKRPNAPSTSPSSGTCKPSTAGSSHRGGRAHGSNPWTLRSVASHVAAQGPSGQPGQCAGSGTSLNSTSRPFAVRSSPSGSRTRLRAYR
jgi:predicted RNA polymerase sigma factor